MLRVVDQASYYVNWSIERLVVVGISILTILSSVGIGTRYVTDAPIIWLPETILILFSWTFFLAMSVAFRRKEHISVELLINLSRGRTKTGLVFLVNVCSVVFLLFAVFKGWEVVGNTMLQKYHTINVSNAWFYASFPVAATISILHVVNDSLRLFLGDADH